MKNAWAASIFVLAVVLFFPNFSYANSGDFSGGVAVGTSYAGTIAAPTNGMIAQGNVGIGTSNPLSKLDVNGILNVNGGTPVAGTSVVNYINGEIALTSNSGVEFNQYYQSGFKAWKTGYTGLIKLDSSGNGIQFLQSTASVTAGSTPTLLQPMTILPNGNVGIGTTVPTNYLDVYTGSISIRGSSSPALFVTSSGSENYIFGANTGITGAGIYDVNRSVWDLVVKNTTGNIGIGTNSPQATLDINGYARLAKNSSQPVACSSTNDGALALTHVYTLCVCNGGSTSWVLASNGTTACSW